jgi:hypothetical protein
MSVAASASAGTRMIGEPPRLPLRIALHVALTSIRMRLSRSLVTVSSVVLAVAFLLTVIGENVILRAVHGEWRRDSASIRHAQLLREVLERPRPALALMRLAATQGGALSAWTAAATGHAPAIDGAVAATALELADWIGELPPSKSYLVLGNRDLDAWLLAFTTPAQVDALLAIAHELKGVRLDIPRARLAALAAGMPAFAAAMGEVGEAEARRSAQVAAAGGTEAVLDRLRTGADEAALAAAGLPVAQVLPGLYGPAAAGDAAAARAALARQIALDRARTAATETVAHLNAVDPSLLGEADVHWDILADRAATQLAAANSPLHQVAKAGGLDPAALGRLLGDPARRDEALAALNRAIASPGLWRKDAWAGIALDGETETLTKRVRLAERQQTRLGRRLLELGLPGAIAAAPPTEPVELRALLAGGLDRDPRGPALRGALQQAAGEATLDQLAAELERRARLAGIERTFTDLGYDPERAGAKTFWLVVLSLLVCTVGIVNTMMMAVTERFREIATMKCLGATDGFVLKSFLIESSLVGSAGALLGAAIGAILVLAQGSLRFGGPFWSAFPAAGLAAAAGIALACGLVLAVGGALLPALKASRMHPIEAMRIDA